MKFGCCLNMLARGTDAVGADFAEAAAAAGFDYLELPLAQMTQLSAAQFDALRARMRAAGMACETCNNFFPTNMRLTGPQVDMPAVLAYVQKALDRAAALGAEYVVFGSGPAKQVPPGFGLDEGFAQIVRLLQAIGPMAAQRGLGIVIEPLRQAECNLINTFAEGVRLARAVDHPAVRVLVDYYHLATEREPAENIAQWGREFLRHVHFARLQGRTYPRDVAEDAGYPPFFAALRQAGYEKRISCEAYSEDFAQDAPRALAFLKRMTCQA